MNDKNNAAQAAEQDLEYVVHQLRQTGRVTDEEGELTDRLDALLSKLRAEGVQAGDERQSFSDWAWRKDGLAIGHMDGQAAAWEAWHERARRAALASAPVAGTPLVDALMARWDDDGATRGAAFAELRDLARTLERRAYPTTDKPAFYINPEVIDHETGDLAASVDRAITWSRGETRRWSLPVYLTPRRSSAPVAGEAQKPTLYQARTRPAWRPEERAWSKWEDCTAEQAADYERVPLLHDWQYEVRRLYAAPQTSEAVRDQWPTDWAEQLKGEYAQGLLDGQQRALKTQADKDGEAARIPVQRGASVTGWRDPDLEQLK